MPVSTDSEEKILKEISSELRRTDSISEEQERIMAKLFQKRFSQALALIEAGNILKHDFQPSGRVLWVVKGRRGEYQVIPDSMFCTCDDYYYRVMGNKKQLCYHLVAQQIAEPLGKYRIVELRDSTYADITAKWSNRKQSQKAHEITG